jgi:hypothetical protein
MRRRHYIVTVAAVLLAFGLSRVAAAGGWSKIELYGAAAALIVAICLTGGIWVMLAPDRNARPRSHG